MRTFLAALLGVASAMSELESSFFTFITEYGKSYASLEEYQLRFEQFSIAHSEITAHNLSGANFQLGHN